MALTHDSYTVAWICALPLELAAAKVMLDEVHPTLAQPASDHNIYTLGSIGVHNVVVVCLPAGVYGTISAAAAVAHLTSTYRNIKFGLMVGIGGGVPRENPDIRLGDIVVSKPTNTFGGVIQYDYGKTIRNGHFHQTGSLNKPPQILLKALAQIESDYMLGRVSLTDIMTSNLHRLEVRKQFPRPLKDQLFQPTYDHVGDTPNCTACDQNQLVDRPERTAEQPHIHYGLIASGNQVMKDGRTRDLIAQGRNILCFEMEAAGLMDEIPSLIIRGICDYCDSHKHKEWQAYAAFAAAAYTKALLIQVPSRDQSAEQKKSRRRWVVPFRKNPGFVGREEEIARVEELFRKVNGPSKVAICGLGGVGKTQIALELAYRVRERDSTCSVFWIPCTSYASVEQAYLNIAQTIGIQEVKLTDAKEHVKIYLSQIHTWKWLLIFDNADDMDMWVGDSAVTTQIMDFLPQSEQGRILFTTRNGKLAVRLASPFVIDVPEPDTKTGVKILEKALKRKSLLEDDDATIALLKQLEFLPLAIIQAAAYINANNIELSDYATLLQEQEPDVIELLSEDFGDDGRYKEIQNPVASTWLISFQQIQQLNPLAADYLSFMACINPRNIPQSLLPLTVSKKRKIEALGLLKAFSFVSEQVQDHALSLHGLVHLSTRNWMRKTKCFGPKILETANRIDATFPDDKHANRKLWQKYLPHALSLIREDEFRPIQQNYIDMLQKIGKCLYNDGRYSEAVAVLEDTLSLQERENSDDNPSSLVTKACIGSIYHSQGRWEEAEKLFLNVIVARKRVLGPEHPDTLSSLTGLSLTYRSLAKLEEAEKLQVQVLDSRKLVLPPGHPEILSSMNTLAATYWNQGRWSEAEELQVQVLESRQRLLKTEHPDTLISMSNLASTYWNQGRLSDAEALEEEVLEIRKRVLGLDHPDTLTSMANLASTYMYQRRLIDAEALEEEVLQARKRILGETHPDTLTTMSNLAATYCNQGRLNKAEALFRQVIESSERVLRLDNPNVLSSMANLASIFRHKGKYNNAERMGEQVLEARKRVLGQNHPDTLNSMANLAATHVYQGKLKEAEVLQVQLLEARQLIFGPESPDSLSSMSKLAFTYRLQGRNKDAEEMDMQAMEIRKHVLGPDLPQTSPNVVCYQHRDNQAREIETKVLDAQGMEGQKKVLGATINDNRKS